MIPDAAACDGGYACTADAHVEGCFRPHVENELLNKDSTVIGEVLPGTFAGRIASRALADIQHDRPTP